MSCLWRPIWSALAFCCLFFLLQHMGHFRHTTWGTQSLRKISFKFVVCFLAERISGMESVYIEILAQSNPFDQFLIHVVCIFWRSLRTFSIPNEIQFIEIEQGNAHDEVKRCTNSRTGTLFNSILAFPPIHGPPLMSSSNKFPIHAPSTFPKLTIVIPTLELPCVPHKIHQIQSMELSRFLCQKKSGCHYHTLFQSRRCIPALRPSLPPCNKNVHHDQK